MCDICFNPYGHDDDCPADFSSVSKTTCFSCRSRIEKTDKVAIFNDRVFCKDCVNDLTLDELCYLCEADDVFDLAEKFELCQIDRIIDTEW